MGEIAAKLEHIYINVKHSNPVFRLLINALKEQGQTAIYEQVEGAGHAFFDWKPNDQVRATFAEYGVPYAAKMRAFFQQHLYGESAP